MLENYHPDHDGKFTVGLPVGVLCAYCVFEFVRPQDMFPPLQVLRLGALLGLSCFFLYLFDRECWKILRHRELKLMLAFQLSMLTGIFVARNTFYWYNETTEFFLSLLLFYLPLATLVKTEKQLLLFLRVWASSITIVAIWVLTHSGRGPGGFTHDQNDVAMTLCIGMVLSFGLRQVSDTGISKIFWIISSLVCLVGIVATNSRGGFVGLSATLLFAWWFSNHRLRNLFVGLALFSALTPIVLYFAPADYVAEIQSISDTNDATRTARLALWAYGWEMFLDNFLIGVGAANFPWTIHLYQIDNPEYIYGSEKWFGARAAHSLWVTLLSEHGILGTGLFAGLVGSVFHKLHLMASSTLMSKNARTISLSILVATISVLVNGTFVSVLFYPHLWILLLLVVPMSNVYLQKRAVSKAFTDGMENTHRMSHRIG